MGMYTRLNLHLRFKEKTPEIITNTLKLMFDREADTTNVHEVYMHGRLAFMVHNASYSHVIRANSELFFDENFQQWIANINCDFKNYDDDIFVFLQFVNPHVERKGFAGFQHYEDDEQPKLIYFNPENPDVEFKIV